MKLIDDERLTGYKFKSAFERMDLSLDYMAGWNDAIDKIGTDLEEESVDAVPVVHAHPERVIEKQGYFRKHFREYCCSVCKHEIRSWYKYCCYCGARLDEVME